MRIYNTLTKTIDKFTPAVEGKVKMYTCGPTVYHFAHIGNLRTYIMEDVLEKYLTFEGYEVSRTMNITDVGHLTSDADSGEDKMLKGAKREHKTVMEIAKYYTDAFFSDASDLNIKKPDTVVPATSMVDEFKRVIGVLIEKGYAYEAGGNVYFDTSKSSDYYALVGHEAEDLKVGVRDDVTEDTNKKNSADFALWFTKSKFEDQELKWDSPWGVGYPGWHIECSCISMKTLGEYLDIHCGGVDNIFPHHTNEIAQSEAYLGHKWCNYWFHVHHLNDETGKMSKSKGDFLTVSLLKSKGYDPLAYRYFCLQSHYRKPLVFSYESLDNAVAAYTKLRQKTSSIVNEGAIDEETVNKYKYQFEKQVGNDLNTAMGITLVFNLLKENVSGATKIKIIELFDSVLSLDLLKALPATSSNEDDPEKEEIENLILQRAEAKKAKNYAEADRIRNLLSERGIVLKDTSAGTEWTRK